MAVVDAIRPPRRKTNKLPTKQTATKQLLPPGDKKPASLLPSGESDEKKRKRLMWLLVMSTALVIFLAWLFLFPGPRTSSSQPADYWASVGRKLTSLWSTIKLDFLNLKETGKTTNTNSSEEYIKQLEDQVFPQFNDPTRQ